MRVQFRDPPWTFAELSALPDDGRRYETLDGMLAELPRPDGYHAAAVADLIGLLLPAAQQAGGRLFPSTTLVFVPGGDPVQPDLSLVLPGGPAWISVRGIEGPPDLIVEVMAPSTRVHDLLTKRTLYGRSGVREYWIADQAARTLELSTLTGDALHSRGVFAGDDIVASSLLPGLAFPAAAVFAGFDAIRSAPAAE